MLDSRHIQAFAEVVRTGTFSAAARSLGYTQPAISQQLRALERAVGSPLFVRSGRRVRLTEAGQALAAHAGEILEAIETAEKQVRAVTKLEEGQVRMCAFPSASATIVPIALKHLRATFPGIRVELSEEEPPRSIDGLKGGDWDVAVGFAYPGFDAADDPALHTVPLVEDPLVVLVPAEHDLAGQESVRLEDLESEDWIAGCERCRAHVVGLCKRAGFEPTVAFSTDDNLAIQSLVAAGLGVAVMPSMVQSFMRHPGVACRPLAPSSARWVTAHTLAGHQDVAVTRLLIASLQEAASGLALSSAGHS